MNNTEDQLTTEDFPSKLTCNLYLGNENNQNINWTWKFKNKTISQRTCTAFINSNNTESSRIFNETPLIADGMYECIATNQFGFFSRTIYLKVKSKLYIILIIIL